MAWIIIYTNYLLPTFGDVYKHFMNDVDHSWPANIHNVTALHGFYPFIKLYKVIIKYFNFRYVYIGLHVMWNIKPDTMKEYICIGYKGRKRIMTYIVRRRNVYWAVKKKKCIYVSHRTVLQGKWKRYEPEQWTCEQGTKLYNTPDNNNGYINTKYPNHSRNKRRHCYVVCSFLRYRCVCVFARAQ